jgi:hypothetical protein
MSDLNNYSKAVAENAIVKMLMLKTCLHFLPILLEDVPMGEFALLEIHLFGSFLDNTLS